MVRGGWGHLVGMTLYHRLLRHVVFIDTSIQFCRPVAIRLGTRGGRIEEKDDTVFLQILIPEPLTCNLNSLIALNHGKWKGEKP